ncbi:response regulator transcription factor [Microbacterium sp. SLBN-146]|uniref:response regulator transcription factor n=1 Tax=Microbacterium sp. SLBN-146 TaxID=2768457 RepID=UPI001152ACB5|nr:response regulator transcription factor [Microbacterium sp. SLBN-146]TQJ32326.1 DNA-binding response OmpR family regulator [Microbacterium sp. SLBN-146]
MPGAEFSRVFWDIIAGVPGPTAHERNDDRSANLDENRVAVVIEDEADIRQLLSDVLESAGFVVYAAASGLEGIERVRVYQPVVTTLDVSMPGIDGFETAKRIRAISSTYIVMLTARSEEIDALQGLESGADDYITKPFRPRELRARIEAMLRRPRGPLTSEVEVAAADPPARDDDLGGWLEHRGLRLQPEMRLAIRADEALDLTRSEFDILAELLRAKGRVVSKSELALTLRGEYTATSDYISDADARAIEVHMANLRRKLGESPANPRWIETVRGVGYRLTR